MSEPRKWTGRPVRYYDVDFPYDPTDELAHSHGQLELAKITNHMGKVAGRALSAYPIMQGDQAVLLATRAADSKMQVALRQSVRTRAAQMQQALMIAAEGAYEKGTGRFARGIKVSGVVTNQRGFVEGKISISLPQYRETRFLTNLGGRGYFKYTLNRIPPYIIMARGAKDIGGKKYSETFIALRNDATPRTVGRNAKGKRAVIDPANPNGRSIALRTIHRATPRKQEQPRLRLPIRGWGSLGKRGGEGRGKNAELVGPKNMFGGVMRGDIRDSHGDISNNWSSGAHRAFYYPIWVIHPGFPMGDVISNTASRLLAQAKYDFSGFIAEYQQELKDSSLRVGKVLRLRPTEAGLFRLMVKTSSGLIDE